METDKRQRVNELLKQLQAPVADLTTLFALLSTPLEAIGLLPPQFRHCVSSPLPEGAVDVRKHIPFLQRIILEHIAPTSVPMVSRMPRYARGRWPSPHIQLWFHPR